jgi:hypothetical protein
MSHGPLVTRSPRSRSTDVFWALGGLTRSRVLKNVARKKMHGGDAVDHERHLPTLRHGLGAQPPAHLRHGQQRCRNDDSPDKGAHELKRDERGPFIRVGGDDAKQRRVGDVDGGVDQHDRVVGDIGPDELSGGAEVRHREGQDAHGGQRHAEPEEERPELAPARPGAVGQHAHDGVEERVHSPAQANHRARSSRAYADHVGIEDRQVRHERLPVEAGGQVAEGERGFLAKPQ